MGHPISNVGVTPDIDARRATLVTNGENSTVPELDAPGNMHQVGFRGIDSPAETAAADTTLNLAI